MDPPRLSTASTSSAMDMPQSPQSPQSPDRSMMASDRIPLTPTQQRPPPSSSSPSASTNPSTPNSNNRTPSSSNSKVSRSRSLTKPERSRPKQGMLNRTPSGHNNNMNNTNNGPFSMSGGQHDSRFDSTGNLIQNDSSTNQGSSLGSSSTLHSANQQRPPNFPGQPLQQQLNPNQPPMHQMQQRPMNPNHQYQQRMQHQRELMHQRPKPQRMGTLRRLGSRRDGGPNGEGISKPKVKKPEREIEMTPWVVFSRIMTCCLPTSLLKCCSNSLRQPQVIQAWREKVTLCLLIVFVCGILAFIIFGLQPTLCPNNGNVNIPYSIEQPVGSGNMVKASHFGKVIVRGGVYDFDAMQSFLKARNVNLTADYQGLDVSALFFDDSNPCASFNAIAVNTTECHIASPFKNPDLVAKPCLPYSGLDSQLKKAGMLSFLWTDLNDRTRPDLNNIIVYDGFALNVSAFTGNVQPFGSNVTSIIQNNLRADTSILFSRRVQSKQAAGCLAAVSTVGILENTTMGCFAAKTIMIAMLIAVCLVVGIKFLMALTFGWFLSYRLTEKPRRSKKNKEGDNMVVAAAGSGKDSDKKIKRNPIYTAMLVTCYSEGESSIRTTLDSLANTTYSSKHKLMIVICDGIIRGHGNKKTTPDIVTGMLELAPGSENPKASSYLAIADGDKQHNMAKVYAGHYVYRTKRCPAIVIVKCGNPLESDSTKPGNRGKRDSQLILMSFFQRVLFADRFTELDYELFRKIHQLMGVWADRFELCLMVDADTMVKGDSLSYMVTAMQNDHTIMGLCGETKIANKTTSWVTAIQVFEYYISHHLGKGFESVFGGVTCLPGCFCMYRIKAPKNNSWVPILANPEVIQEYNQNVVSTLHEKNLLLLGEDRYLTTLMLRTFPKRQMVFVPQAMCKTVVPDTFAVLLSQRRRWINSTIHNLLELVLVTDLCGIAFLSMQFVVLLELIGTVVLPASILFTVGMIAYAIITQTLAILPMVLIIAIIGLPAVLIVLTTRKWIYVLWMLIYLMSLPIWNFVLPLYSFWHFDDFSWGETRKVADQKRKSGQDHGDGEGEFESGSIVMRKWEEWEKERLKSMGYRVARRRSADRGMNDLPPPAATVDSTTKVARKVPSSGTLNLGKKPQIQHPAPPMPSHSLAGPYGGFNSALSLPDSAPRPLSEFRPITPNDNRPYPARPIPQSTPNLLQEQQMRAASPMGGPGVRPRHTIGPGSRPPSQHNQLANRSSGSLKVQRPPQDFELGPMPSMPGAAGIRSSTASPLPGMIPPNGPLHHQQSVRPVGPGMHDRQNMTPSPQGGPMFRPPNMYGRPPGPGGPPGMRPPPPGMYQQQGPGMGMHPRPPGSFQGMGPRPPRPVMMMPPQHQQHGQQPPLLLPNFNNQAQDPVMHRGPTPQFLQAAASYPLPPSSVGSQDADRPSRLSHISGVSSGGAGGVSDSAMDDMDNSKEEKPQGRAPEGNGLNISDEIRMSLGASS